MKKQFKLGVIGGGSMAVAVLRGVVLSDFLKEKKIIVSDKSEEVLDKLNYLGVRTTTDNKFVAENSEYLLFAVNSKDFEECVKSLKGYLPEKVISVMPAVKKSVIKNTLGVGVIRVARCVPNLPCCIGSGAIGIDMTDFNKFNDDTDFISNVFNKLGTIVSIDESKMDAVTALGGGGPAYAFIFIESLIDAGVKQGLTRGEAKILAVQTVLGSAEMVQREDVPINELVMQVCNNGGAAIEAVKVLEANGFSSVVEQAVGASVARTKELSAK